MTEDRKQEQKSPKVHYLWFGGKDGWQVTSFHPKEDPAIGFPRNGDYKLFVDLSSYERLQQENEELKRKLDVAIDALSFYACKFNYYLQKDKITGTEVRRSVTHDDCESFGFQASPESENILQIIAGKTARNALKEIEGE